MRVIAVTFLGCLGCAPPVPLEWTVSLSDPSLCAGVVAYEARIERDGCGGEVVYQVTRFRGASEALPTPDRLSPGRWGFRVRARDADCRYVADRCIERQLPSDAPALDVDVTCGAPGELGCAAASCEEGVCVEVDPPPPPRLAWPPSAHATGSVHAPRQTRLRWDRAPSATRYEVSLGPPCDGPAADCPPGASTVPTDANELALDALALPRQPERRAWTVRSCRGDACGPFARPRVIALDRLDGDLDADGYADLLAGAPEVGGGRVARFAGPAAGAPTFLDPGLEASARFGLAVASADVNGDGRADVIVGAPFADGAAGGDAGRVFVARGGAAPAPLETGAGSAAETLGAAVAVVGDLDGDGFLDVALGAPQHAERATGAGRVVVLFGSAGGLERPTALSYESAPSAAFGAALAGGDLDGDGYADLVVGEPGRSLGASAPEGGRVLVFRGGPRGLAAVPEVIEPSSPQPVLRFGQALAVLPDLDGDGIADLAVGAPGWDPAASPDRRVGRVFVYSGRRGGLAGVVPQELASPISGSPASGERFGAALATGDLNGDGRSDLVVGAPAAEPDGAALVYLSAGLRFDAAPSRFLDRAAAGAELGAALGVGDLDGDGFDDVAVIARGEERLRVYLGEPSGPLAAPSLMLGAGLGLRGGVTLGR
ncbi:MAG: FG-GAP repeat protein [Sandaracinaceae bacterium]|nr:FG-GAP repeat protein [Sandaracinaceae bacterium]